MLHACYILYCAVRFPHPSKKKFSPSVTGDIDLQSSHWNNGKMKIAYNSAYVQIEIINFTFAQQAVIVYSLFQLPRNCYAQCQILSCTMPTADKSKHSAMVMLHPHCSATCVLYVTLYFRSPPTPAKKQKKFAHP